LSSRIIARDFEIINSSSTTKTTETSLSLIRHLLLFA
jgi:hypothetical protein